MVLKIYFIQKKKKEKKIFIDDFFNKIISKNIRYFYDEKIKFVEIVLKVVLDQNYNNNPNFFYKNLLDIYLNMFVNFASISLEPFKHKILIKLKLFDNNNISYYVTIGQSHLYVDKVELYDHFSYLINEFLDRYDFNNQGIDRVIIDITRMEKDEFEIFEKKYKSYFLDD